MMRPVPSPVWETWNNWATFLQLEDLFHDDCLGASSIRRMLWYKVFCCVLWSELGPLSGRINAEDIVTLLPVIEWLDISIEFWLCIYIFVFAGFFCCLKIICSRQWYDINAGMKINSLRRLRANDEYGVTIFDLWYTLTLTAPIKFSVRTLDLLMRSFQI